MFYFILLDNYLSTKLYQNYTIKLTIFYLKQIFILRTMTNEECIVIITVINFA